MIYVDQIHKTPRGRLVFEESDALDRLDWNIVQPFLRNEDGAFDLIKYMIWNDSRMNLKTVLDWG